MNSSISGSDRRRWLWTLVLPVVFVGATIAAISVGLEERGLQPRLIYWGKSYDDYDVIYTKARAARRSGKKIVAFIGDSRIEWGLDPYAVQRALDLAGVRDTEVFNLAIPGRNVRTMLTRLNEVGFYPDILVVGYSHLSFYWSKNFVNERPHQLSWFQSDYNRIRSFAQRKIIFWPYAPIEILNFIETGIPPGGGSWLDRIDITPRGQARVHYMKPQADAIAFQKQSYQAMYSVAMSDDKIAEINTSFLKDMTIQREHGTRVLLLKMPLSPWALDLEKKNERMTLGELAAYLKVPAFDGNDAPGATDLPTFDGLHLTPSSSKIFGEWIGAHFVLPYLRIDHERPL